MPYEINEKQFNAVLELDGPSRYSHFISKVADWQEVWSLKNQDGYVTICDDRENKGIPFWPHPNYAGALAKDEWENCHPHKIDLSEFLNIWLPGMQTDNLIVAVFPTPKSKGIIVEPLKLKEDLLTESEQYE